MVAAGIRHPLEDVLALDPRDVHLDAGLPAQTPRTAFLPINGRQCSVEIGVIGTNDFATNRVDRHFLTPRRLEEIAARDTSVVLRLRSEENTSELHSLIRTSYTDFCLKNKKN